MAVNGMSYFARDGENANSALLISVAPEDFGGDDPLAGVRFQRKWEQAAFAAGGGDYSAPRPSAVGDFLAGRPSVHGGAVRPSYRPGVKWTSLDECLPDFVTDSMRQALPHAAIAVCTASRPPTRCSRAWRRARPPRCALSATRAAAPPFRGSIPAARARATPAAFSPPPWTACAAPTR